MVRPGAAGSIRSMYGTAASNGYVRQGEDTNPATTRSLALVLIEPDESVRDALATLLRGEGWRVIEADCGQPVAGLLDRPGIAAVISESALPDLEPGALLDACAKRGLPLIFTGHELPLQSAVDLIRMGASDYLEKPFLQSRLLDLLKSLPGRQNR